MSERMHLHIPPDDAPARDAATPRPWTYHDARERGTLGQSWIDGPGMRLVADCSDATALTEHHGYCGRVEPEVIEANARLIVRAVNAHDALVAALSEVMGWIGNWSPNFEQDEEWPATAEKARAALALTEGGAP